MFFEEALLIVAKIFEEKGFKVYTFQYMDLLPLSGFIDAIGNELALVDQYFNKFYYSRSTDSKHVLLAIASDDGYVYVYGIVRTTKIGIPTTTTTFHIRSYVCAAISSIPVTVGLVLGIALAIGLIVVLIAFRRR